MEKQKKTLPISLVWIIFAILIPLFYIAEKTKNINPNYKFYANTVYWALMLIAYLFLKKRFSLITIAMLIAIVIILIWLYFIFLI